jgi:hypothetical protein
LIVFSVELQQWQCSNRYDLNVINHFFDEELCFAVAFVLEIFMKQCVCTHMSCCVGAQSYNRQLGGLKSCLMHSKRRGSAYRCSIDS